MPTTHPEKAFLTRTALLALAACGPAGTPAAPSSGAAAGSPEAQRPRERLDMTSEERARLSEVYRECLDEHGVTKQVEDQKGEEATKVCRSKEPLPPWEYDTANPEAADFQQRLVRCLRDKGVRQVAAKPVQPGSGRTVISLGGAGDDQDSIGKGLRLIPVCEKELVSGGQR